MEIKVGDGSPGKDKEIKKNKDKKHRPASAAKTNPVEREEKGGFLEV